MAETSIQWTDYTFNAVEGCEKVSPGCKNCYAEAQNKRLKAGRNWGPNTPRLGRSEAYWREPLKWNAKAKVTGMRPRVFCASVADVFEDHPDWVEPRARLFKVILETPHLDWLLLTKRPENIERLWPKYMVKPNRVTWHNVWLGTTVENPDTCWRLVALRGVPAVVHFVSMEPLLEATSPLLTGIDWVIIGGESGRNARPFDVAWARDLVKRAREAGAAPFVKQLGARVYDSERLIGTFAPYDKRTPKKPDGAGGEMCMGNLVLLKDRAGGDMAEWRDESIKVREFPTVRG